MEPQLTTLCRTCLVLLPSEDTTRWHNLILERDLAVRFVECTLLTLDAQDEFPKCICSNCYEMLQKFNEFQKMCAESMVNFKHFLKEQIEQLQSELKDNTDEEQNESDNKGGIQNGNGVNELLRSALIKANEEWAKDESTVELEEVYIVSSTTVEDEFERDKVEEISMPTCDTPRNQKPHTTYPTAQQASDTEPSHADTAHLFHCQHCPNRWFYKQENLDAHLRTHQGLKPYVCQYCNKGFGRATTLRTHLTDMHGSTRTQHSCPYAGCKKSYAASRTLQHHINTAHLQRNTGQQHICEQCGKCFGRKLLLQRHCYVHMDKSLYPYACERCDKRFWSKQFLRDHVNRHAGRRQFVCLVCEVRKCTKAELKRHMLRHTGVRPFKCELCKCSFLQKQHLIDHMRRKHQTA